MGRHSVSYGDLYDSHLEKEASRQRKRVQEEWSSQEEEVEAANTDLKRKGTNQKRRLRRQRSAAEREEGNPKRMRTWSRNIEGNGKRPHLKKLHAHSDFADKVDRRSMSAETRCEYGRCLRTGRQDASLLEKRSGDGEEESTSSKGVVEQSHVAEESPGSFEKRSPGKERGQPSRSTHSPADSDESMEDASQPQSQWGKSKNPTLGVQNKGIKKSGLSLQGRRRSTMAALEIPAANIPSLAVEGLEDPTLPPRLGEGKQDKKTEEVTELLDGLNFKKV